MQNLFNYQFHRLMQNNTQNKVSLVEYIVNPELAAKYVYFLILIFVRLLIKNNRFEKKRAEFEKEGYGKPVLGITIIIHLYYLSY